MKPRLAAIAALGRELAIPASVLASIAAFGSAGFDNSGAAPIVDRLVPLLAANATFSDKPPPIAFDSAEVVTAVSLTTETEPADPTPVAQEPVAQEAAVQEPTVQEPTVQEPEPIVIAALTDSSETLPPETPPEQVAKTDTASTNTPNSKTRRRQSGSRLYRSSRRVFCRRHLYRSLPLGGLPTRAQGRRRQDPRTEKSDRQEKGQTCYCHEDLHNTYR